MAREKAEPQRDTAIRTQTLGVVSFLNARPLWKTLQHRRGLVIHPAVPARLAAMLADRKCDAALLPVIDYWEARHRLVRVSDACIASDGETMTVRVFSRVPPERIQRLHADADSHTSIVLAEVLWRQMYRRRLEIVPWTADTPGDTPKAESRNAEPGCMGLRPVPQPGSMGLCPVLATAAGSFSDALEPPPQPIEALLLIGDKVVTAAPEGFPFQVDLGHAWKQLTGLPFVFAAWYGEKDHDYAALARLLEEARDAGTATVEQIAAEEGPRRGWPVDTAARYLRHNMRYTLTPAMRSGMDRFFSLVYEHRLVE